MALGINLESGSGSFLPYCKYDAKAGRWFRRRKDREESDVDITDKFVAIFDFESIKVGWVMFSSGAPIFDMVGVGEPFPKRPSGDNWKQGFRIHIALAKELGGGVYEVMASARAFLAKIDRLHDSYLANPKSREGLLPVVRMMGVDVIETQGPHGVNRNYAPKLEIAGWQKPTPEVVAARQIEKKEWSKPDGEDIPFPGDLPKASAAQPWDDDVPPAESEWDL